MDWLQQEIDGRGVATLSLNRPDKHNAFDDQLITALNDALDALAANPAVRLLVLRAEGKHFSAGADLAWMKRQVDASFEQNLAESEALAGLMDRLDRFPHPSLVRVQGAAFGGALGLIACGDIAVAADNALFCLSEVKLGLIPAVISPYVLRAMGPRVARRYMLTAERFNAEVALRHDLVHEVVPMDELDGAVEGHVQQLLMNGPQALKACKQLIQDVQGQAIDAPLRRRTAEAIAKIRVTDEGQEGLGAFFDKRRPAWQEQH
ncbi:enoyl-CoA hydratase/isomerase family protein [Gallaecimonas sp. GXIMD4217]|uniref:enoyl-CoA hydratase/isomerase family protein n=1 Tax=Gallaecimonas sp. GXIMD4217 TaxID=3131927 RepID=UPI00311ABD5E